MPETAVTSQPLSPAKALTRSRIPWLVIFLIWFVVYVPGAWRPSLLDDADSTHAEAAREMYVAHDYVTLHVNGVRYLEKPPLPYWLVASDFKVFGVSEFGVRLPIILGILALIGLAAAWGTRAFGRRGGIYAGLFSATCLGYFLFTRIFIPDALLSLFLGLTLYFFITALDSAPRGTWRWYAAYASLALAVLAKGLVALIFAGAPVIGYMVLSGEWRRWRELRLLKGFGFFLLIAAPWHILCGIRNHGFFWFYFVNEHFLRFLGERYPRDYNKMPALAYWGLHLVWLFPWSMYLPVIFRDLRRDFAPAMSRGAPRQLSFAARTRLLCWIWAGVVIFFFAFSTNQEYYTLPAYLPLLILLAGSLALTEESRPKDAWVLAGNAAYFVVGIVGGAALTMALWASRNVKPGADLGSMLVERHVANNTLSMSHFFDLTTAAFADLRTSAALAAFTLVVGSLIALILRLQRRNRAATWAMGCSAALLFVAAQIAFVRFGPYLSSHDIAQKIARAERPGDKVMIYGDQAYGSSLLFYLRQPVDLVNGRTTSMWFGSTFPDAPHIFLDDAQLEKDWRGPRRIFLFVPPKQIDRVDSILPQPRYVFDESSGKVVYTNRQ